MVRKKVVILGAAGRDFHDFNMLFRDNKEYEVVAFTAAQIPFIADRTYPRELSGKLYPRGIRIHDESELLDVIRKHRADICLQAYSDTTYNNVMHNSAIANAAGADFWIVSPERTMLRSKKRVIAICAARTGSGKSQTTRYVSEFLRRKGVKAVIIRHPMPYGILKNEIVERFERKEDLDRYKTTIEEREEYEQHINNGFIVYAGVDYEKILRSAEKEADVIIWDGGNNDAPFIRPDLMVAVIDPLRPGDELAYYPGEVVVKIADIVLINKANSVTEGVIASAKKRLGEINKDAVIVVADSEIKTDNKEGIRGKRVLLIEDGPTITHGGMPFGAAMVASQMFGAKSVVEARKYAVGTIKETFEKYPLLKEELPAMGYSKGQISDLEKTINRAKCDIVVSATPIDLRRILDIRKPMAHVTYDLAPRTREFDRLLEEFARSTRKQR